MGASQAAASEVAIEAALVQGRDADGEGGAGGSIFELERALARYARARARFCSAQSSVCAAGSRAHTRWTSL